MYSVRRLALLVFLILVATTYLVGCGDVTYAQPTETETPDSVAATEEEKEPTEFALHDLEQQTIDQFERLAPSVVYVTNIGVRRIGFSRDVTSIPQGSGSGFIWDKNGTIITNFHVVNGASDVEVTLADGSVWKAKPVGFEPEKDLAVIKIEAPADQLKPIPVGKSNGLKVGQHVTAIGNPFGFDNALTTGVFSGLDREIRSPTQRPIQGVIQTDAAINPGNSGGPLLDSNGRLIGMNTAIFSPSGAYAGIGFAVPVDHIGRSVPEILEHGKVTKPGLGLTIASPDVTRRLNIDGLLLLSLVPDGPAEKAGLRATARTRFGEVRLGDVIVRLDETRVKTVDDLFRFLDTKKVGDKVTVEYVRENKTEKVDVVLERVN